MSILVEEGAAPSCRSEVDSVRAPEANGWLQNTKSE